MTTIPSLPFSGQQLRDTLNALDEAITDIGPELAAKADAAAMTAALAGKAAAGPIGSSGVTMTAGILGRESGTGAPQVYSLGSGLAIVGGALTVTGGTGGGFSSLTMPTGFGVSGNGTASIVVTFAAGYSLPTNTLQASWTSGAALAATAVQPADLATGLAGKADLTDARFTNAREWSATTMTQAEAEEGVSTVRRATNALLLRQSAAAWWQAASGAVGKLLAAATTQAEGRSALGLGSAATAATTDFATPAALATGLAGKADLVGGVIPTSQIPSIAISEYLGSVASQAAMLALVGQRGDWCIRTDGANAGAWILSGEPSSSLTNWVQVPMPTAPVQSVNGQVGAVVLGPANVGAATAAQGALAATAIQPGDPALSDAREWSAATVSQAEAEAGVATTRRAWNALRVRQAIEAWWAAYSSAIGQALATAANAGAARSAISAAGSGAVGSSGLTMATARLLGRTTAGSGAVEEISVTGGSFTGGVLTLFDPASPGAIGGTTPAAGTFTGLLLPAQGSAPAAPATGLRLYANTANALSWIGANGFVRVFDGTANTADRTYTLPNASGTIGLLTSSAPSNLAATAAVGTASDAARADHVHQFQPTDLIIPLSGRSQNLAVGTVETVPYWPRAQVLTGIPVWMADDAPAGAALQFDIRIGGTSIFFTLPTIAAGETNSTTTTAAVFSTAFVSGGQTIALGSSVTFLVTQIGSSKAGAGLKVALPARRAG